MHDSALDFIVFILVLGFTLAVGLNLTIPIVKESKELYYQESYDKTVGQLNGDKSINDFDGCMTSSEIVITSMGQTYFMPKPGYLDIGGTKIVVSNNVAFSPNSLGVGTQAQQAMNTWFSQFSSSSTKLQFTGTPATITNARFKIGFDLNNPDDPNDDSYSVYILLKRNTTGAQPSLYRCMPNGQVRDGGGNVL